jgi:phosphoribosylamine--glycine ligase
VAWKLAQSPAVRGLYTAPGNYGSNLVGANVAIAETDPEALADWAKAEAIDLTVVVAPVAAAYGVVDAFKQRELRIVGPSQAASQIETSRSWAKQFMARHAIPSAPARWFEDAGATAEHVRNVPLDDFPLLLTAERDAEPSSVLVDDRDSALVQVQRLFSPSPFTPRTRRIVVEPYPRSTPLSVLAIGDGATVLPIGAAQVDRHAFDGGTGPLVEGMGAYSPVLGVDDAQLERVLDRVIRPIFSGIAAEGVGYTGVLCVEVAIGSSSMEVRDIRTVLGGLEAQVLLPRWEDDLYIVLDAAADAALADLRPFRWRPTVTCGVVVASEGYPGEFETGYGVLGFGDMPSGAQVFHLNTRTPQRRGAAQVTPKIERAARGNLSRGFSSWFMPSRGRARKVDAQASQASGDPYSQVITSGGPVLTVVGSGRTLAEARAAAYRGVDAIAFTGCWSRHDIGLEGQPPPG